MRASRRVIVNGSRVPGRVLAEISQAYGALPAGRYWYDGLSGLFGVEGGPAQAQLRARLDFGGMLEPGASAGETGVFLNGRELHELDFAFMGSQPWPKGYYWLDDAGNIGRESAFQARLSARLSGLSRTDRRVLDRVHGGRPGIRGALAA